MTRLTLALADLPPDVDPDGMWVDHTDALRTPERGGQLLHVTRGRADEVTAIDASTATVRLNNPDRTYDPRVGTVRTWMHAKVELDRDVGGVLPLFRGYIERIGQLHEHAADRWAEVHLVDVLKWLARTETAIDRPQELTGARIAAVLDAAGWPVALRDIDDGQVLVDATDESDVALQLIRTAVEAEDGTFEQLPDGRLRFSDRHARLDLAPSATIAVEAPVSQAGEWSDDLMVNVAKVELADGTVVRYADQDKVDQVGEMLWESPDLPVPYVEAEAAGMWRIFRYADDHERTAPVTFDIVDLGSPLLEREIGELVVLQRRWPDETVDELDVVLEGIEHDVTAARWTAVWQLSPWWGDEDWLVVADTEEDDVPGLDEGVAAP